MEVDRNGENYLFYLASKTNVSLEDIVYVNVDAANIANASGETPLIRAARFDNDFLVKGLLKEGARADTRGKMGRSALDYSIEYDYFGPTFLLLSTADPNVVDAAGRTPLMNAAANGNRNAIRAFVVAFGFAENAARESKKRPAAERKEMLALAARFRPINLNVQDRDGKTALMLAAEKGDAQIAESLIRMRVNNQLTDKKGKTALAIARENGHTEIIKLLTRK
jgi:ankyrin repeat protein